MPGPEERESRRPLPGQRSFLEEAAKKRAAEDEEKAQDNHEHDEPEGPPGETKLSKVSWSQSQRKEAAERGESMFCIGVSGPGLTVSISHYLSADDAEKLFLFAMTLKKGRAIADAASLAF